MARLGWDNVDFDTMNITLTEFKGDTKAKQKAKHIPINQSRLAVLKRREQCRRNGYVFAAPGKPGDSYMHRHVSNLLYTWKLVLRMVGLKECRVHDIRHWNLDQYARRLMTGVKT